MVALWKEDKKKVIEKIEEESKKLNKEQERIYRRVIENRKNVFINGKAGVGKTYLLHKIYEGLMESGYEVITVAFTGKAASILPGRPTTVSRSVGMKRGIADFLPKDYKDARAWNNSIRGSAIDIYRNADDRWTAQKLAVMIDEAGQLSSENARLFYQIGMYKRNTEKGLEDPIWVFSADIGQLQAVEGNWIFKEAEFKYWETEEKIGVIKYKSLIEELEVETVNLTKIIRQEEREYQKALKWIYYGIAIHPIFIERLYEQPPENTTGIYFNNDFVIRENNEYIKNYLKNNPTCHYRVYKAITVNITESDLRYLAPVQKEMTIAVGMPFLCTENVPDRKNPKKLLVSNGEQVTVIELGMRHIRVRKHNGVELDLDFVYHSLPNVNNNNNNTNSNKDKKKEVTFYQLPGYAGPSISLYKIQGTTIDTPRIYGAYEVRKGERYPLSDRPGSMYVMLSRNTKLSDVYFDTSFGIEEAFNLLKASITYNAEVRNYLLKNRRPLWVTDYNKDTYVVELINVHRELLHGHICYLMNYIYTELSTNEEKEYYIRYTEHDEELKYVSSFIVDKERVIKREDDIKYKKQYIKIANYWYYDWMPTGCYNNFY